MPEAGLHYDHEAAEAAKQRVEEETERQFKEICGSTSTIPPPTASPIPIEQHPPLPLQELERDLFGSIPLNLLLGQTLMPSLSA